MCRAVCTSLDADKSSDSENDVSIDDSTPSKLTFLKVQGALKILGQYVFQTLPDLSRYCSS